MRPKVIKVSELIKRRASLRKRAKELDRLDKIAVKNAGTSDYYDKGGRLWECVVLLDALIDDCRPLT